jgi:hypothetical protein
MKNTNIGKRNNKHLKSLMLWGALKSFLHRYIPMKVVKTKTKRYLFFFKSVDFKPVKVIYFISSLNFPLRTCRYCYIHATYMYSVMLFLYEFSKKSYRKLLTFLSEFVVYKGGSYIPSNVSSNNSVLKDNICIHFEDMKYVIERHLEFDIVARMVWRLCKTGYWIDNWIYWITHNYSVCTPTAHYSSL